MEQLKKKTLVDLKILLLSSFKYIKSDIHVSDSNCKPRSGEIPKAYNIQSIKLAKYAEGLIWNQVNKLFSLANN